MLLTQEEVAQRLRKSPKTIQRLRNAGEISFISGRPVTFTEAAVQDYIERTQKKWDDRMQASGSQMNRIKRVAGKSSGPTEDEQSAALLARLITASLKKS